jgi:hypothetical protein
VIGAWLAVYNDEWLHQALGYKSSRNSCIKKGLQRQIKK